MTERKIDLKTWTLAEAARVMDGYVEPDHAAAPFGRVTTDSRAVTPGDFFLALKGEKFDGHRFCAQALEAGAAGLILDRQYRGRGLDAGRPAIYVADPLRAYGDLAAEVRRRWAGPVLAISGSAGKTTTRRLVAAALSTRLKTLEPMKNFNNLIGVPHTLLRLEPDHQVAVVELGMNQPGELARLTAIAQPSVAMLTQIGRAHIGMFGTMRELAAAKLDLFRACPAGTPLVVNAGCKNTAKYIGEFRENYPLTGFRVERPSMGVATDVRIEKVQPIEPVGYRFTLVARDTRVEGLELRMFGRHNLDNVAAAAAIMLAAGYDPAWLADALPSFTGEPLRGEWIEAGELRLILDCYNAAPQSMISALESLAEFPAAGRRVIVLADMLELGAETQQRHEMLMKSLVRLARRGPIEFYGLGPFCSQLARDLVQEAEAMGGGAAGYATREALIEDLRARVLPGDLIFFKGSHGYGLEAVARAIVPDPSVIRS